MSDLMYTYMVLCQGCEWKDSRCKLYFHAFHLDTYGLDGLNSLCVWVSSMQVLGTMAKQCKDRPDNSMTFVDVA